MLEFEKDIQGSDPQKGEGAILLEIDDIEHDLSSDIKYILNDRSGRLFLTDRFKCGRHCIDIVYPRLFYPGNKSPIEQPDYIRFLLSLYPDAEKLEDIDTIILQPRHIEMNGVELVSVYIRSMKILVLYLHRNYLHPVESAASGDYSFIPFFIPQYIQGDATWSGCVDSFRCVKRIPPLWHILSVISFAPDNRVDKFFLSCRDDGSAAILENLDNISSYYARHGY